MLQALAVHRGANIASYTIGSSDMEKFCKVCFSNKMGIGIATGVAIGSAFGAATGNMAQAIGFGAALGVALGAIWTRRANGRAC